MKPGIVFSAVSGTISKNSISARGEAVCTSLIEGGTYAEAMTAVEIALTGNATAVTTTKHDTLIYTRSGSANLVVIDADGTHMQDMKAGSAALIKSGASYTWKSGEELRALEVSVPDLSGPFARKQTSPIQNYQRFVQQGSSEKAAATSNREFEVLYDADNGSAHATMFVGFIPPSGAPAHYHLYDEICHIVQGGGELHVGQTVQELAVGSTFIVAPRLLHGLVNNRDEDLCLLGIFRPAGSPAAAYYPDGQPAPGYIES
ncbi:unannotated protein [freshwater metagenome]|uniref:Unannotated protein n=1 Tax=freshwater metagenome TaxID=449393 RepID=A0A6J7LSG0_9ZZZZ|nr:cupin domain-containing protein [Actinomycetota bacterium]MSW62264.1 cupin domain-containing protein [Actinomycetota bacterium]MSX89343.1 cupin domain-containing protein [Actinomycetota bacterium]MSZ64137.1 cupin domain-containing protein [Actinomycetota bacterium]MTA57370.1 cupin domain-containing protein [Actinomycetota bacterium]